jgi:hypothetical protein
MRYRAAAIILALGAAVAIGQVPIYSDYPWGLVQDGVDRGPVWNLDCRSPLNCTVPSYGNGRIELGDGGTLNINVAYAADAGLSQAALNAFVALYAADAGNLVCSRCVLTDRIGLGAVNTNNLDAGAVTAVNILDSAIIESKLAAAAVTSGKIAASAVGSTQIADGAVLEAKVGTGAITNTKLGALAVDSGKLAAAAVTTAKLATGAVTSNELGAAAVTTAKLATGAVTSNELGAAAVTTAKLATGAVTSNELGAAAVTTAKLASGAVDSAALGTGAVTNAKLGDLSISSGKLQDGAVLEAKVGTGAITNAKLGDLSISSGKLQDGSVLEAKVGTGAITNAKLGTASVTNAKVASQAIDWTKLDDGTPIMAWDEGRGHLLSDRVTFTSGGTKQTPEANQGYTSWAVTSGTTDFYVETDVQFRTLKDQYVSVTYRTGGTTSWAASSTMRLYNMGNTAQSATATMYGDGEWHTAIFDISAFSGVSTVRFDPQDGGAAIGAGDFGQPSCIRAKRVGNRWRHGGADPPPAAHPLPQYVSVQRFILANGAAGTMAA